MAFSCLSAATTSPVAPRSSHLKHTHTHLDAHMLPPTWISVHPKIFYFYLWPLTYYTFHTDTHTHTQTHSQSH